ncbi:MAG: hypothetical protein ABI679_03195 [Gemmatimonadota bacterium]
MTNSPFNSLASRWRTLRALPVLNPASMLELVAERRGHDVNLNHLPHLASAVDWIVRAQDATPDDGIARGYSLKYDPYFRTAGWQASYPETTGYIIPTLMEASRVLQRPELLDRAVRAASWESAVQMESGAVQGGVIGQGRSPAVFNTGQVLFGWLAVLEYSGSAEAESSARRASDYLTASLESDGHWRKGNSLFAKGETTLYNARVAWALAEAGERLGVGEYREAASRNLHAVADQQLPNGWFPNCCLTDPNRPLLHTLAYTTRGLLEGGRVLEEDRLLQSGILIARALARTVREDGWMPGRYRRDWSGAVPWSCLTGEAQMANNWMRLYLITGDKTWLEPVPRVLAFLKRTQNRSSDNDGLRGGIKGSFPMSGDYGRFEILNWATKYFADALMRHQQILEGTAKDRVTGFSLA